MLAARRRYRAVWVAPEDEVLGPVAENAQVENPVAEDSQEPDADDHPVGEGTLRAPWRWEQLLFESAVIGARNAGAGASKGSKPSTARGSRGCVRRSRTHRAWQGSSVI